VPFHLPSNPPSLHLHPRHLQIFAPTDAAIDALLVTLGNGRPVPREALFRLPELQNIIMYHIVPGRYSTGEEHATPACLLLMLSLLVALVGTCTFGARLHVWHRHDWQAVWHG
jgi:hypothetical protein